jgi:hypothetical protein
LDVLASGENASENLYQGAVHATAPWGSYRQLWRFFIPYLLVYTSNMEQYKIGRITRLQADCQIKITEDGSWNVGDLELLHSSIALFAEVLGGNKNYKSRLGEVLIERTDTGGSLGLI